MMSGVGQLAVITRNLTETDITEGNILFPGKFVEFTYTGNSTPKEAKAWSYDGKLKTVSSAIGQESYILTLAFQYLDWSHLGFGLDEMPQTSISVTVPVMKNAEADSAGTITDADIPATEVKVYVSSRGEWGEARYLKASEFTANAGSIQTSAAFAKAPMEYTFERAYNSIQSIGHESEATSYGKLSFIGMIHGPEFPNGVIMHLPDITRQSIPSIQTGDVPRFEIQFAANVPSGSRVPHRFYNVATAA